MEEIIKLHNEGNDNDILSSMISKETCEICGDEEATLVSHNGYHIGEKCNGELEAKALVNKDD